MSRLKKFKRLPSLIVFDLDYTLWPFWVDTHVTPPFKLISQNPLKFEDANRTEWNAFPDSDAILKELRDTPGVSIACASRTAAIRTAKSLISTLQWQDLFNFIEIFPSHKIAHFNGLKKASGVDFKDMLFFDDEFRNINDVRSLGVTCIHADDGISWEVLEEGLKTFESMHN